jgi:hypothetical protein
MHKVLSDFLSETQYTENEVPKDIKNFLSEQNACYILITCKEPSENGEMKVAMTYEGDKTLAQYLIESAQGFIDHDEELS